MTCILTRALRSPAWQCPVAEAVGLWMPADTQEVRQHLNMRWGVMPFRLDFEDDPEVNVSRTFR